MHEYRISAVVSLKMNFQGERERKRERETEREREIVVKQISNELSRKGEITFLSFFPDAAPEA